MEMPVKVNKNSHVFIYFDCCFFHEVCSAFSCSVFSNNNRGISFRHSVSNRLIEIVTLAISY